MFAAIVPISPMFAATVTMLLGDAARSVATANIFSLYISGASAVTPSSTEKPLSS